MKKVILGLMFAAIAFTSCTKERVDAPEQKATYKTYHLRVDGIETTGTVISSTVVSLRVNE